MGGGFVALSLQNFQLPRMKSIPVKERRMKLILIVKYQNVVQALWYLKLFPLNTHTHKYT